MSGILALILSSHAFAPSGAPIEPNRIYRSHAPQQLRLRHQPGWVEFTEGEGRGWEARFDERTGTAHRAWGPGIPLGRLDDERSVRAAMDGFIRRNEGLFGVESASLRFASAGYIARTDTWYVQFDRLVQGAPIWRGGVTARIRFGKLILLGVDTYPDMIVPQPEISAAQAIAAAELVGPAAMAHHTHEQATLVALPLDVPGGLDAHLAWEVRSRTTSPRGHWVSFVDAATGLVLATYDEIRYLDGTVYGTHPARTLDGEEETTALPLVEIEGESSLYAGEDGSFSVAGDSATTWLRGSYVTVLNASGREGELDIGSGASTWTTADATLAEIATYAYVHQVRDWQLVLAPEVGMAKVALTANVNDTSSTCNAYYDGNLNFYEAGGGCNNTGQIADVVYHEWGHGFHYYSLEAGSWDGSVGEGTGDTVSTLMTHDSEIAPWFVTNGSGIRDVAPNRVYPDDVVGEVHEDGLIFAGSVWDVWAALLDTTGEARADKGQAYDIVAHLFAEALKAGPTIDSTYEEFIVADDDDGDLGNGTPHFCDIAAGFALHGLGPLASEAGALQIDALPLENQAVGQGITLNGEVLNLASACVDFDLAAVELSYTLNGGKTWTAVDGTVSASSFSATLPDLASGSIVGYSIEATGSEGESVSWPTVGKIAPFTFYVGELDEIWCAALQQDDGGFTHALLSGDEREGADDWVWGRPSGSSTDPDDAYSGNKVWGNDLGGDNYNGDYQPEIVNRLSTPPINVSGAAEVIVQYRRWLNVEDGYYDQARVYGNDEVLWTNHASSEQQGDENTADDQWVLATHRAALTDTALVLGWEIESDQGYESGGWNIDDVCVYTPAIADSLYSVLNFVATDDQEGEVGLSWTQPEAEGFTSAVVVRRDDRFAIDAADGTVVYTGSGLLPGLPVSASDPFVGHAYYTVLVGSDSGFGVGATAGANADEGTGLGGGDGVAPIDVSSGPGCGCAAASGGAYGSAALVAAVALFRRRRC